MTLIERYLLRSLLLPFVFCFISLASLWIIADLFGTLDDFIENKTPLPNILSYYTAQIPIVTYLALPITILLATMLSLHQLRRHQEITAMLASGISIHTIIRPYLLIAILASLSLYLLSQSTLPKAEATRRGIIQKIRTNESDTTWISNLIFRDPHTQQTWFLGRFNTQELYAENVEILQQHYGQDQWKYFARRASWKGHSWLLQAVKCFLYNSDSLNPQESWHAELTPKELTLPPHHILLTQSPPQFTPTPQLKKAIKILSGNNHPDRYQYTTELAFRYTTPLIPLIFLITALAAGLGHLSARRPVNVAAAIFTLLSYWLIQEISRALGSSGRIPPTIAATIPITIFLVLAIHQFYTKVLRH